MIARVGLLDSQGVHTAEEYFEYRLHIVDEHLLEVALLPFELGVRLLFPHLEDDALVDVPVADVRLEIIKSLRLLLRVLRHPITFS